MSDETKEEVIDPLFTRVLDEEAPLETTAKGGIRKYSEDENSMGPFKKYVTLLYHFSDTPHVTFYIKNNFEFLTL